MYAIIEFRNEHGKRKWHSGFRTKKEAKRFLDEQLYHLNIGTYVEHSKLTLRGFIVQWMKDYAKNNTVPRTYQEYKTIVNQHLIPKLGQILIDK
ncbi:AP2-like DNA-binding integrase domain-containing protein [Seinonella peptonophila]|uniref:AP2-like DNA-binding integrase domain-containing protein n=1 Tax=Seinonella peptonophila TaxID=112248 RepID=A0A1M5AYG2_9BACL|nr:Arm DNA-binding domain-containing protein [Seinonella peptonophila]SHF35265.1 AP2-like DNA-binding integrase domain-containing protein [Seinonella peptonophila]